MCQVSNHGSGTAPFSIYETIAPSILWYPCREDVYETIKDSEVNKAIANASFTKEILMQRDEINSRPWGYIVEDALTKLGEADSSYVVNAVNAVEGSTLSSYKEKSAEDFNDLCEYYVDEGYELYCSSERNENLFATYTKDSAMVCLYWLKEKEELNLVTSDTAAANLPPAVPEVTNGYKETVVVQLQQTRADKDDGMGYVIRLADGSFIIIDGGRVITKNTGEFELMRDQLWRILVELNGNSEENIVVRAWILTNGNTDHISLYRYFGQDKKYKNKLNVENLIYAPIDKADKELFYHKSEFKTTTDGCYSDVKPLEVHTGMNFQFCNLNMEILCAPEEFHDTDARWTDINDASMVIRLYSEDYSMIFLSDAGAQVCNYLVETYGDYLKSDMCQVSNHGSGTAPFSIYETIAPSILWYPCREDVYETIKNSEVNASIANASFTKEILMQRDEINSRPWGYTVEESVLTE